MRILIGSLLLIHGLIHIAIYASPGPADERTAGAFGLTHSWLLSPAGLSGAGLKSVGTVLWVVAGIGFVLAGLVVLAHLPLVPWAAAATVAAVASLALFTFFWHPWIVAGLAADVVVLVGLHVLNTPWLERLTV